MIFFDILTTLEILEDKKPMVREAANNKFRDAMIDALTYCIVLVPGNDEIFEDDDDDSLRYISHNFDNLSLIVFF